MTVRIAILYSSRLLLTLLFLHRRRSARDFCSRSRRKAGKGGARDAQNNRQFSLLAGGGIRNADANQPDFFRLPLLAEPV
jgi:hypothetical protein